MEVEKIWLSMRHFLTNEYRNNIYMGQQQYPICNTDIITNGLIERLDKCTIFASPLKRSMQTVDYITNTYKKINFRVIYLEQLAERGLGDFEGKFKDSVRYDPEYFVNKKFIVTKTPPNGENFFDFRMRVDEAVRSIKVQFQTQNIMVISHLQTLRMIRFCVLNSFNYDIWHDINYAHGEVVEEKYGKKS